MNREDFDKLDIDSAGLADLQKILLDLVDSKLTVSTREDIDLIKTEVTKRMETLSGQLRARNKRRRRWLLSGVVGCFVIILVCSIALYYSFQRKGDVLYTSQPGEISKVIIQGSTIHLNSNTRLVVRESSSQTHSIDLKEGEIFIDNPKQEYFEIFYKDKVAVFFNGSVDIVSRGEYDKISSLDASVRLKIGDSLADVEPNQQFRSNNGDTNLSYQKDFGTAGLFTKGYFQFDNDPFKFVCSQLSSHYRLTIVADNKEVESILVSGVFDMKQDPVAILRSILPPPHTVTRNGSIILIDQDLKLR